LLSFSLPAIPKGWLDDNECLRVHRIGWADNINILLAQFVVDCLILSFNSWSRSI